MTEEQILQIEHINSMSKPELIQSLTGMNKEETIEAYKQNLDYELTEEQEETIGLLYDGKVEIVGEPYFEKRKGWVYTFKRLD